MTTKKLFKQTIYLALAIGIVLAGFVSASMFYESDLSLWLLLNNSLVVVSLSFAFLIGFRLRRSGSSILSLVSNIGVFYLIVIFFYVGSYALITYFFADRLAWMPFFHRDYTYHGFRSVRDYMNHKNNFVDLLVLQVFSALICSVLYFGAGIAGSVFNRFTSRTTY